MAQQKIADIYAIRDRINEVAEEAELKPASATTLGGIKVGENLTITSDGTLNATGGGGSSVTVDTELNKNSNNPIANSAVATKFEEVEQSIPDPYSLPIASTATLGGIKIGENLTISEDGTVSASGGSGETDHEFISEYEWEHIQTIKSGAIYFIRTDSPTITKVLLQGSTTEISYDSSITDVVFYNNVTNRGTIEKSYKDSSLTNYGLGFTKPFAGNSGIFKLVGQQNFNKIKGITIHFYLKNDGSNITNTLYCSLVDKPSTSYIEDEWEECGHNQKSSWEEFTHTIVNERTELQGEIYFYLKHGNEGSANTSFLLIDKIEIEMEE